MPTEIAHQEPTAPDPPTDDTESNAPPPTGTTLKATSVEQEPSPAADRRQERKRQRRESFAIVTLSVLAVLYTMYFARAILLPVMMGLMLAMLLRPVVRRCNRYRIPESVSAALLLLLLLMIGIGAAGNIVGPASDWIDDMPTRLEEVGTKLRVVRKHVDDLSAASEKMEAIASGSETETKDPFPFADDSEPKSTSAANGLPAVDDELIESKLPTVPKERPIAVEVKQPPLVAGMQILSSTGGILAELVLTLILAYFLLASGDTLINNILHVMPSMREKRNIVELVYNVEYGISSYLLTVTLINIGLGIVIAVAMWLMGVPNAMLWGVMAAAFNYVPFLGAMVGAGVMFVVSVLSFESLAYAVLPPVVYWLLTAIEGNFVTPHLLGRRMSLNPIMVFLSLTLWGWMWGIGGAVLAVPILAAFKIGCDQFERTRGLGTLLGGSD